MSHRARFCKRCGQAFHGHGLWGVCPGCRAELRLRRRERRMGFGLRDEDWVDPDDEPETAVRCGDCPDWEECPCGCGNGWCRTFGTFTAEGEGCDG